MGFDEWLSHDNFFEVNPWLSRNGGPPEQLHGESSELIIEETINFIERARQSDRPFFAVVWFGSPHEPYSGLPDDLALYDDIPARYPDRFVSLTGIGTGLPVRRPLGDVLRERFAEITAMDRAMGTLRTYLDREEIRPNTLLWYCGDNGVPASGRLASPFRGRKAQVYEGGIRVPGIIEWPKQISHPLVSDVNAVTSDILPTLCDLLELPLPDRPLDGISLKPLIDGTMTERPEPVCFWDYATSTMPTDLEPWIASRLQQGTTPLVKKMDGRFTRSFRNFHHGEITAQDYAGSRAILDNRWKLVVNERPGEEADRELFDLRADPAETNNLVDSETETARDLEQRLRRWQDSVLGSLMGADYH